jgi:alpha-methylacyl-CoA racemase
MSDPTTQKPALPLAGIRVLDLSRLLPGGLCSLLLADYGADVLKVEDTGDGDYLRWWGEVVPGAEPSAGAPPFVALNRCKRSIRIDLKSAAGRDVILRLAESYDVLLESFRPGVMDRLGLGYKVVRKRNRRIVYCAITGFGQDAGRYRGQPAHDLNYVGLSGLLDMSGQVDGPPVQPAMPAADVAGGSLLAGFGVLAALRERERSGEGQFVDVPMTAGTTALMPVDAARELAGQGSSARGESIPGGGAICYRPYECADGGWVTLGALEGKFWRAWCEGVGRQDLVQSQFEPPRSTAHAAVETIFRSRPRADWIQFGRTHPCCLEPVLTLGEALDSDLAASSTIEIDQPGAEAPVRAPAPPVGLSRTPADPRRAPAPALGADTETVLREVGYDPASVEQLLDSGAVAGVEPGRRGPAFLP